MSLKLEASLWARAVASWSDLEGNLRLPAAESFPLPLPSGDLVVDISVHLIAPTAPGAAPEFEVRLETEYEINPDGISLHGFTLGRTCRFTFTTRAFPHVLDGSAGAVEGTVALEVSAKLPALPALDSVRVRSGDAEGWTRLRFEAEAQADADGRVGFRLSATLVGPFEMDLYFPGIPQPTPPLHLQFDIIHGEIQFENGQVAGRLGVRGEFRFAPQLAAPDLPVTEYLKPLLDDLELAGSMDFLFSLSLDEAAHHAALSEQVTGPAGASPADMTVSASLLPTGPNPEFCLCATFRNARKDIYLFDLLRSLSLMPSPIPEDGQSNVGLGFGLRGLCLCLSRTPSFAIEVEARAGVVLPAYLMLSTTEVRIGLGHALPGQRAGLRIPLRLPHFSREEFGFAEKQPINEQTRQAAGARPLDQAIYERIGADGGSPDSHTSARAAKARYDRFLDTYFTVVEQIGAAAPDDKDVLIAYRTGSEWNVRPPEGVAYGDSPIHVAAGVVGERQADGTFETSGELAIACQLKGEDEWHLLLAKPALEFVDFFFSMTRTNPRDIRVGGSVRFTCEGPFGDLSKYTLTVGLSADLIYFSLAVDGNARIDIPEIIPGYGGGSVAIGKLMFGFGYLKRSLAVAFAGELVLPERLVDDLDTSDDFGAGIRLPVQSKLAFQFDLMPIVVGKFVIPIPLFQFNWDLRRDVSPALTDVRTCEPFWDGLQLVVPDVVRISLKRISYSAIVGIHCSSNSDFDGDLMLGDGQTGLTVVADNIWWAYGIDGFAALMLAPVLSVPFCDNFCVNLRLDGFGLHFNVQRPIPSFSPLAVFEILALAADPFYQIAPRGELADMVRATLADARLSLPEPVRRLFPQAAGLFHKPLDVTINIATFLTICQRVAKTLKPFAEAAVDGLRRGRGVAEGLRQKAAELRTAELRALTTDVLAQLPPELRRLELAATFAGFEAGAVLVLLDPEGTDSAMKMRGKADGSKPPDGIGGGVDSDIERLSAHDALAEVTKPGHRLNFRQSPDAPRLFDPSDPDSDVLGGVEFEGFSASDLEEVRPAPADVPLVPSDVTAALLKMLKSGDRPLSKSFHNHFSGQLLALLAQYAGGVAPEELVRLVADELNRLLEGEGLPGGSLYDPTLFADIDLGPELQSLVAWHQKEQFRGKELLRLNRLLFEAALPGALPRPGGVLVAAHVRVFGEQRFRFIGYLFAEGSYSLVTSAAIAPLELSIAGLTFPIPFGTDNGLRLAGRTSRDGVVGSVRAEGMAFWEAIDNLLFLEIGVEQRASLELFSDGRFSIEADATAKFFNNAICRLASAVVSVSHTHCFVSGRLEFTPAFGGGAKVLELYASAAGHVGPGPQFRLSLSAEATAFSSKPQLSRFCGIPFANLKGTLSEAGMEIEARLAQGLDSWATWPDGLFQPKIQIVEAALRGRIDARTEHAPDFSLEGALALRLFDNHGPLIKGRGGFSVSGGKLAGFVEGALNWQGRDWLRGRVELKDGKVTITGEASLAFRLMPTLPGAQVAGLMLALNLGGEFTLKVDGQLDLMKIHGTCMLAVSLPGRDQLFPVASAQLNTPDTIGRSAFPLKLVSFKGLAPIDLKNFSVTLPKPELKTKEVDFPTGVDWDPKNPLRINFINQTFSGGPKLITSKEQLPTGIKWPNDVPSINQPLPKLSIPDFDVKLALSDDNKTFVVKVT